MAVGSGSTAIASLAAQVGFDAVWIEMEHAPTHFERVDAMCMAAEVDGAVPLVRVPDGRRHHVLGALEAGARIVVVPMTNTPEQARRIVEFGKYTPVGMRGLNTRTRNLRFGLLPPLEALDRANRRTFLFAQIETLEAVENLDAMCRIDGLAGIFVGPGDLSASMGMIGQHNGPKVMSVVLDCLKRGKAAGKLTGLMAPPGALMDAGYEAGAELVICAGDLIDLSALWPKRLEAIPAL